MKAYFIQICSMPISGVMYNFLLIFFACITAFSYSGASCKAAGIGICAPIDYTSTLATGENSLVAFFALQKIGERTVVEMVFALAFRALSLLETWLELRAGRNEVAQENPPPPWDGEGDRVSTGHKRKPRRDR